MSPIQEKRFEYNGFPCVILFMSMGYRCGYVGLPKGTVIDVDEIRCHGGITYKSHGLFGQDDTDRLWIGFDCSHCFDGYDVSKVNEYFGDCADVLKQIELLESTGYFAICNKENPIRTLEYCEEQCKSIVDQVIEMGEQ